MKNTPDRFAGAFAVFFTAAFPFVCGNVVRVCHRFFVDVIAERRMAAGVLMREMPPLPAFVLNNIHAMLWVLFGVTLALSALSLFQSFVADAATRLSRQFVIAFAGALLGLSFLVLYLLVCIDAAVFPISVAA